MPGNQISARGAMSYCRCLAAATEADTAAFDYLRLVLATLASPVRKFEKLPTEVFSIFRSCFSVFPFFLNAPCTSVQPAPSSQLPAPSAQRSTRARNTPLTLHKGDSQHKVALAGSCLLTVLVLLTPRCARGTSVQKGLLQVCPSNGEIYTF
jgi:hypothetical protein